MESALIFNHFKKFYRTAIYCYKEGKFTREMTMEQMIDFCAQFTDEINRQSGKNLTVEQARMMMRQFFPQLKRWKQSNHVNQ